MRILYVMLPLLIYSEVLALPQRCWAQPVSRHTLIIKRNAILITDADKEVFEALWSYFHTSGEPDLVRVFGRGGRLMDTAQTLVHCDPGTLKKGIGDKLAIELIAQMERRAKAVSLKSVHLKELSLCSEAQLGALIKEEKKEAQDKGIEPDHGLILWLGLPGYSYKEQSCLVTFRFDDGGRHGGGYGCCYLIRRKGAWRPIWKNLSFSL